MGRSDISHQTIDDGQRGGSAVTTLTDQSAVPAEGQLVTVRNRRWVAAQVVRGEVASADPQVFTGQAPHLVRLVSVEDDARDEELRVVWELEPGRAVHDSTVLPGPGDGFDDPAQLDAFLDAVRWGAIASADRTALQAPFRSGVEIEDYQLDPVVRALSMPRTNLLIADDVGLGKTIESGLVMQELMLRHRARTMVIVCPAGLTRQWRDEMRDKFGLEFRIVDSALLRDLRRSRGLYANPWTHYPRLIVSVDWLKRDRPLRLLREVLPTAPRYPRAIDLLVVDEIHTCAPAGRGRYATDSQRTKAIRILVPHCEHRLFLSATPHNGYLESFTALLELLDDQRFARGVKPTDEQLARVMVRRLKSDLPPRWDGSPRFPVRRLDYLEVDYPAAERHAHELLSRYAASRRDAAADRAGQLAADFVTTLLKRRLFSSPKAFAETVDTHLATMSARAPSGSGDTTPVRDKADKVLRPVIDRLDETTEDDQAYGEVETDALTAVRRWAPPLSTEEKALLTELRTWARSAQHQPDAKFIALRAWLDPIVRPGGDWSDERVIIFTEYRDTQRWLHERLVTAGYPAERIALLFGGQDPQDREHVKNVFTEDPALDPVRVLLATDAASEGINLQRHCHRLLHWEIPWNPNRLEQRNGRIDRHGQRAAEVQVLHFVPAGWQHADYTDGSLEDELAFLRLAVEKVEAIRTDLGSAGEVIATQVEQKMTGKRTDWRATDAEIGRRASRARLRYERDLARELQRLTEKLHASRTQLNLTPATVERVVRTALRLAHRRDLIAAPTPADATGTWFRLPELPGAWATARTDGLLHPVTGRERPVTFDPDAAKGRTDVVLLHLGHRLVGMCLRLLRAELWSRTGGGSSGSTSGAGTGPDAGTGKRLHRVTARIVPGELLRSPALIAHGRVVITGTEGTRLHEEIITAGGPIVAGKLTRARQEELDALLAAATDETPAEPMLGQLVELWPTLSEPLSRALAVRADQRKRSLYSLLEQRCAEEVTAIGAVLDELAANIRARLDDAPSWEQPSLFELEREQLHADRDALRNRLRDIPAQRQRETDALRRRYADPTARWFPAAVTCLVPASLARGAR
ncbi:DISARM system SNF2-like helicase DrmD [Solwaraspora sp. WMMA2065]|uniref:DISARM system SNF2-like helicase DrmD n=1 Tax=Solwaraspora sp. WMMA2065 TaxID=3015166 RepID=UPI00259BA21C|nr:DISARM system SNF2-like helicase DrmD [Solwaraspora sp. WMMA2065]WJK37888.1 DISARM system SNF2-like helicase DrmD [Solwaraspora sp. WMMA2065]